MTQVTLITAITNSSTEEYGTNGQFVEVMNRGAVGAQLAVPYKKVSVFQLLFTHCSLAMNVSSGTSCSITLAEWPCRLYRILLGPKWQIWALIIGRLIICFVCMV